MSPYVGLYIYISVGCSSWHIELLIRARFLVEPLVVSYWQYQGGSSVAALLFVCRWSRIWASAWKKKKKKKNITKTCLYNFYPLKPHFNIVKLGFTGVFYLISAPKHRLWVLVRTASPAVLTSTHNLCFEQKYEKYQNFSSENFHFLVIKFSVYLNRHVLVMKKNNNKMACLPSEDSVQPGNPPSLTRDFAVRMKKAWVLSYP